MSMYRRATSLQSHCLSDDPVVHHGPHPLLIQSFPRPMVRGMDGGDGWGGDEFRLRRQPAALKLAFILVMVIGVVWGLMVLLPPGARHRHYPTHQRPTRPPTTGSSSAGRL